MASLHKHPGTKFWRCSFFDPNTRKWRMVSTGCTKKSEAMAVCARMESLANQPAPRADGAVPAEAAGELLEAGLRLVQKAAKGEMTEAAGLEFVNRILKASAIETIEAKTAEQFLDSWLEGKQFSTAQRTAERYRTPVARFKESLGRRAKLSVASITKDDVEKFRRERLEQVSAGTLESDFKILKGIFERARDHGTIPVNPFAQVEIKTGDKIKKLKREAFTAGEVDLLVTAAPTDEWKTTILLGFYTGMRLGDAVLLDWDNVDFAKEKITYTASKTGSEMEVPMHPKLTKHLNRIAGDKGGKVSPKLAAVRVPGRSGLSLQFLEIMKDAGLDVMEKESTSGRKFSSRSFHSLRHGFVSAMANAEVAPELRQKLAGHRSKNVHSQYTHIEFKTLTKAVRKIK